MDMSTIAKSSASFNEGKWLVVVTSAVGRKVP